MTLYRMLRAGLCCLSNPLASDRSSVIAHIDTLGHPREALQVPVAPLRRRSGRMLRCRHRWRGDDRFNRWQRHGGHTPCALPPPLPLRAESDRPFSLAQYLTYASPSWTPMTISDDRAQRHNRFDQSQCNGDVERNIIRRSACSTDRPARQPHSPCKLTLR